MITFARSNDTVDISGLTPGDLRLLSSLILSAPTHAVMGRDAMVARLAGILRKVANGSGDVRVTCAASTGNPSECYVDTEDQSIAVARYNLRLARAECDAADEAMRHAMLRSDAAYAERDKARERLGIAPRVHSENVALLLK